jgi:hypothetical protein
VREAQSRELGIVSANTGMSTSPSMEAGLISLVTMERHRAALIKPQASLPLICLSPSLCLLFELPFTEQPCSWPALEGCAC